MLIGQTSVNHQPFTGKSIRDRYQDECGNNGQEYEKKFHF
jgi:hypothetical protein